MSLFKRKKHEYDEYFYGLVIAKSKSLIKFVNEHPAGSDYARKKIIAAKADIAKIDSILNGFFIRVLESTSSVKIHHGHYVSRTDFGIVGAEYVITNEQFPYGNLRLRDGDTILIDDGQYELTKGKMDIKIFHSVYKAIAVQQSNASAFDFNVRRRKSLEKYTRDYGQY